MLSIQNIDLNDILFLLTLKFLFILAVVYCSAVLAVVYCYHRSAIRIFITTSMPYICMCVEWGCVHIYMCVCVCVCVCVRMCLQVCMVVSVCMCIFVCPCVCECESLCVRHVCVYVCARTHTYTDGIGLTMNILIALR